MNLNPHDLQSDALAAEASAAEAIQRKIDDGMCLLKDRHVNNLLLREGFPVECELVMDGEVRIAEVDGQGSNDEDRLLSRIELKSLAYLVDPEWESKIHRGGIDGVFLGKDGGRYRANIFLWGGKPMEVNDKITGRLGCMMRVIPEEIPALEKLGLPAYMRALADANYGLLLVVGPTGAGKTTTVASYIEHINQHRVGHIITIQDPIEYVHQEKKCRISPREIGTNVESFEVGVKDALRELPLAIAVGEIRNAETLQQTMRAAHSGHYVTATRHAPNLVSALRALVDDLPGEASANAKTVAETLLGVVFQVCVPGLDNEWHYVHEVLNVTNSEAAKALIEKQDWTGLRSYLAAKGSGESGALATSLNENLAKLVVDGKVSAQAADRKAYNRPGLAAEIMWLKGGVR
jgi:twitching motility protein PilT